MKDDTEDSGTPTSDDEPGTIEEGTESVRRTIVGGRPLDRRRRKVRIPIGIEKVLCAAAADREFREQLLMARADALPGSGLEVSDAEATILGSVSEDALRTMIENIDLKRHKRRRFFRGIAAASLAATTAMGTVSCGETVTLGIDPDDFPKIDVLEDSAGGDLSDVIETLDGSMDLGETAEMPDEIDPVDLPETIVGSDTKDPTEVQEIQVDDVQTYAGVTLPDTNAQDADEIDVDIQPVPAGIPPMEDVKEPK